MSLRYEWKYKGKVHEVIEAGDERANMLTGRLPQGIYSKHDTEMKRGFERDRVLLEAAIAEDPLDSRVRFYLGNTYNMLDRKEDAIVQWAARVRMGGWREEIYMSAVYIASALDIYFRGMVASKVANTTWEAMLAAGLVEEKQRDQSADVPITGIDVLAAFRKAHEILPYRQEALFNMAKLSRIELNDLVACAAYSETARAQSPFNELTLMADRNIYKYGVLDELCKCAFYVPGKMDVGEEACRELILALEQGGARVMQEPEWMPFMLHEVENSLDAYKRRRRDLETKERQGNL